MSALRLVVTAGAAAGAWVVLEPGGRVEIGSGPEAGLRVPGLAPAHAEVRYDLRGPRVRDLAGGCRLNGEPFEGAVSLRDGDVLSLGDARVTCLRRAAAGAAARPNPPARPDAPMRHAAASAAAALPAIPGVELLAPLGAGAAGTVYQGLRAGQPVAVKVLGQRADAVEAKRLAREAELSARLEHPALPAVHGLVEAADGTPALVRELVVGESLAERVARDGALEWRHALALGATLADALQHAHAQGVIHRDVKPQNVILGPQGPWLIDLGLGRSLGSAERTRLTASREGLGTLLYMAPEQLADAKRVDGQADVYGLALTLYFALQGEPPFMDVEPDEFLAAKQQRGPTRLPEAIPQALRAVLRQAYAADPAARPVAAHLARALRQLNRLA